MLEMFMEELSGSSSVPKASSDPKFGFAAGGVSSLTDVLFLDRGGRAKFAPKLESDLELEPLSKLGCSSFGVWRGNEYFGLLALSKVEFALGNPGENPCPKLNELAAIAAVADSVVQTKIFRSEA